MLIFSVAYAIAFGAVATGSINAHEAEIVAGIISNSNGIFVLDAVAANIGNTNVVVAKFEFTSVKKVILTQISNTTRYNGMLATTPLKPPPIRSARPLSKNALAMVMPAPNINRMPQGIVVAVGQSNKPSPLSERMMNIRLAPSIATVASPIPLMPIALLQPPKGCDLNIHKKTTKPKIEITRFSSLRQGVILGSETSQLPFTLRVSQAHVIWRSAY